MVKLLITVDRVVDMYIWQLAPASLIIIPLRKFVIEYHGSETILLFILESLVGTIDCHIGKQDTVGKEKLH